MPSSEIVIVGAARTPVGSFSGSFAALPAHELGRVAIEAACARAGVAVSDVDEFILGQVLAAGQGQNPARQASINAGARQDSTAFLINQVCGSGLRTVALGAQQIAAGDAKIVVAGGQENMSLTGIVVGCPLVEKTLRLQPVDGLGDGRRTNAEPRGDLQMIDSMIRDGLWDAFNGYHMGVTAENVAKAFQITREDQDKFAVASQNKAEAAQKAGKFKDEIAAVTVKGRKGDTVVDSDEYIRHGATMEAMSGLKPAFQKDGTVTAANASGINDGAAALVLMSAAEAKARGATPLARVASWATAGVDPALMGTGPIPASKKALEKAGWKIGDLDLIEANEAFAAQALSVNKDLGWDPAKVNVNGGAIAIGHPIGASGARILTTLLYEMGRSNAKKGLATLCIGGGMGVALCVER